MRHLFSRDKDNKPVEPIEEAATGPTFKQIDIADCSLMKDYLIQFTSKFTMYGTIEQISETSYSCVPSGAMTANKIPVPREEILVVYEVTF